MSRPLRVGVFGAGLIGSYLGVRLSAGGTPVVLVGRRLAGMDARSLRAVALDGTEYEPSSDLIATDDAEALADVDVCLLTVKSSDTASAGRTLSALLRQDCTVVSFQNGLQNAARLRRAGLVRAVPGMVSFNVFRDADSRFVQATSGPLVSGVGDPPEALDALERAFAGVDQPLQQRTDIEEVLAGKLLLNLNNGICAVTGASIAESLRSRNLRWCFARCMSEGLGVMRKAGIRPARVVALPPALIARLLSLPDFVVLRAARRLITIDPGARSSTLQDLERGKPTEIDDLNGEIVRLASEHGCEAPANQLIVTIVHELERAPPPLAFVPAAELRARVESLGAR